MSHQRLTFCLAAWTLNAFLLLVLEYAHLAPGPSRGEIAVLMGVEQQGQKASFFAGVYHPAALLQSVKNSKVESTVMLNSVCACHSNHRIHLCTHGKTRVDKPACEAALLDDTMQVYVYDGRGRAKGKMQGRGDWQS